MTGVETFHAIAPELLAAAAAGDDPSKLLALVRRALAGLQHYDLPVGWKDVQDPLFPTTAWVAAFHVKLQSPNYFMRDFRIRSSLRKQWNRELQNMLVKVEQVASFTGLKLLDRAPRCGDRMAIQVVRLVPSVREFLRDDDNAAFSCKQLGDALQDVGLIKEDRREWLTPAPLLQDVSPIGRPVTLFILRPRTPAPLTRGVPDVHVPSPEMPRRGGRAADGGVEEGRTVPRPRRQART